MEQIFENFVVILLICTPTPVSDLGKGLCHEEKSATVGEHIVIQTIFQVLDNLPDIRQSSTGIIQSSRY